MTFYLDFVLITLLMQNCSPPAWFKPTTVASTQLFAFQGLIRLNHYLHKELASFFLQLQVMLQQSPEQLKRPPEASAVSLLF